MRQTGIFIQAKTVSLRKIQRNIQNYNLLRKRILIKDYVSLKIVK